MIELVLTKQDVTHLSIVDEVTVTPHAVSTAEKEHETKIKETIDKLLEDWK